MKMSFGIIPQGSHEVRAIQVGDYISYDPEREALLVCAPSQGAACKIVFDVQGASHDKWYVGKMDKHTVKYVIQFLALTHGLRAEFVPGSLHELYRIY